MYITTGKYAHVLQRYAADAKLLVVALIQEIRGAMCDTCLLHRHLELIIVAGFALLWRREKFKCCAPAKPPKMRPAGSLPAPANLEKAKNKPT